MDQTEMGFDSNGIECQSSQGLSKKTKLTKAISTLIVDHSIEEHPIGLKLVKTPSFVSLLERELSKATKEQALPREAAPKAQAPGSEATSSTQPKRQETTLGNVSAPLTHKSKKASNFHFSLIKIGNWERKACHHKDLLAKFEYSRRKLVWEISDDKMKMKMKIEIKWSDILSMRAGLNDHTDDTLEVELEIPPIYFVEGEPQPKKYISWDVSTDFTGEQANLYRIHRLQMAAGKLKTHYQKLVQWDDSMLSLSKKPFPSAPTPYFADPHDMINQTPQRSLGFRPTHSIQFQQFGDTRPLLVAPTTSRIPEIITQYQYPPLSFRQPAPITSQQPQQLQYLVQPIVPPPMGIISCPPPVFVCNQYCACPVRNPPPRDKVRTGKLILPRAPIWPSGQAMECQLVNDQYVRPVQQVQPTLKVPPLPQNSPSSLFQGIGGSQLNQNRSEFQELPALPISITAPTMEQIDESHMIQNGFYIQENFTETQEAAPGLANNGEAPSPSLIPNEDVEVATNKMSFQEVECCLLSDEPSTVHTNEEKILDEVNSMTNLLKSRSLPIVDGSVVEDQEETTHQKEQKDMTIAGTPDAESYSSAMLIQPLLDGDNDFLGYFADYKSDRTKEVHGEVTHETVQHDLAMVETTTIEDDQQSHSLEDKDDDFLASFLDLSSFPSPVADQASS